MQLLAHLAAKAVIHHYFGMLFAVQPFRCVAFLRVLLPVRFLLGEPFGSECLILMVTQLLGLKYFVAPFRVIREDVKNPKR